MMLNLCFQDTMHDIVDSHCHLDFKDYIDAVDNRGVRHRLKQIAGLAGENEKPMNKTAKRAKQQAQYTWFLPQASQEGNECANTVSHLHKNH